MAKWQQQAAAGTVAPVKDPTTSAATESALIALLAAVNLAVTFGYQWLPVVKLGVGADTDALFVSTLVPTIVLAVVSSSLTAVLTPELAVEDASTFHVKAWTYTHWVAIGSALVFGALLVAAPSWTPWLVPGFDAAHRQLTTGLVRIQLVAAVFTMLLMAVWAAAYARRRFLWVEVSSLLAAVAGLVVAWWGMPDYGVRAVAWGLVLRAVLQVLLLVPCLGPFAWPDAHKADGGRVARRMLPLVGGALYFKTDPLVERVLASFAPAGQLSLLHLAQQLYAAGNQVLTRALINPAVPALARLAAAHAWDQFAQLTRRRLGLVLALSGVAWLGLLVVGRTIMLVALARWLTGQQIELLHALLVALIGVWIGGAAGQLFTTAFFSYGNTVTPTTVGIVGFTLGIPLKLLFFWRWGVLGLAVATSLYTLGNACAHAWLLRRDLRDHRAAMSKAQRA